MKKIGRLIIGEETYNKATKEENKRRRVEDKMGRVIIGVEAHNKARKEAGE